LGDCPWFSYSIDSVADNGSPDLHSLSYIEQ